MDRNFVQGTLPASWGTGGAMQMLDHLTLNDNNLTGSIPASWGDDSNGHPHFAALKILTLKPGMHLQKPHAYKTLHIMKGACLFMLGNWMISVLGNSIDVEDLHLFPQGTLTCAAPSQLVYP